MLVTLIVTYTIFTLILLIFEIKSTMPLNVITPKKRSEAFPYETHFQPTPTYQKKGGGKTFEINEADFDLNGNPVIIDYDGPFTQPDFFKEVEPLSYDLNNPEKRMIAMQAVQNFASLSSSPNVYGDPLAMASQINNLQNEVASILENAQTPVNNE